MKNSEIKELTTGELMERVEAERAALTRMKINHTITPLENPMQIKTARRTVSRLLTELRKRELTEK